MKDRKVVKTKDGSSSIYVPELNEHYHSINGAVQESRHIFIDAGLKQIDKKTISIYEVGFGTGLNAMLTLDYAINKQIEIDYRSIEKYPVSEDEFEVLNFRELPGNHLEKEFRLMHESPWNTEIEINKSFRLSKFHDDLKTFIPKFNFDLCYFDAFAPEVQPALWQQEIFERIFTRMNRGGILTTYSAKGVIRRRLKAAGFLVEKLPGPPGKREITRARKE